MGHLPTRNIGSISASNAASDYAGDGMSDTFDNLSERDFVIVMNEGSATVVATIQPIGTEYRKKGYGHQDLTPMTVITTGGNVSIAQIPYAVYAAGGVTQIDWSGGDGGSSVRVMHGRIKRL